MEQSIRYTGTFFLDTRRSDSAHRLRYRIRWRGARQYVISYNLGYTIEPAKWSKEAQRCVANSTHGAEKIPASEINRAIARYEDATAEAFHPFRAAGRAPTDDELRGEMNRRLRPGSAGQAKEASPDSLFDALDLFTLRVGFQNAWSDDTHRKFATLRRHLSRYDHRLRLSSLTEDALHGFMHHLIGLGLRNTSIAKIMAQLRWFLRWAHGQDLYAGRLHETFRPRLKGADGQAREVIYLTWEELMHLNTLPIDAPHLRQVRDVFCFCCFTGLRYSDARDLRRTDVAPDHIRVVTQKTSELLTIDLNRHSRAILDRYAETPLPDGRALPVVSNVRMNAHLKTLGRLAGFDAPQRTVYFVGSERIEEVHPKHELLTTHCGRRTFIVNALYLGIPAEVIMKWTGHNDFDAMRPYVAIVESLKSREMEKFNRD